MNISNKDINRFIRHTIEVVLIFIVFSLGKTSAQNHSGNIKGWQIKYKPFVELSKSNQTNGNSQQDNQLDSIAELKKETKDLKVILDITSRYVRLLTKQRDQIVYLVDKDNDSSFVQHYGHAFHYSPMADLHDTNALADSVIFTDQSKKILGYHCFKAILKTKEEQFSQINIWFTKKLPEAYWPDMSFLKKIPGCVLQLEFTNEKQHAGIIVQSIVPQKWPTDHFSTHQSSAIGINKTKNIKLPNFSGGSAFKFGFARIKLQDTISTTKSVHQQPESSSTENEVLAPAEYGMEKGRSVYIDTSGIVAFDQIVKGGFLDKKFQNKPTESYEGSTDILPTEFVMVRKGSQYGVLTVNGKWILRPEYDTISTRMRRYWVVDKKGKESLFGPKGFLLPFLFEKVWRMDDNYFNVVQNGKWGVYSRKQKSLTVPAIYEDMDYCYGCEIGGDYCFAKKDGKWGVIDFNNKILLPFDYDHEHWNMRSDEWVTSFYKNGQQLVINLKTGSEKICPPETTVEKDSTVLAQGFVRVRDHDKYGLVNAAGKQILPSKFDYIRYDADEPDGYYLPAPFVQINENHQWGVADTTGNILIPPIYTSGIDFKLGRYFVCERKKGDGYVEVLLDKSGKRLLDSDYTKIELVFTDGDSIPYFKLEKNGRYGFYNPIKKILIAPEFDRINHYLFNIQQKNAILASIGSKQGLFDINTGKAIVPANYEKIDSQDPLNNSLFIVGNEERLGLYDAQKKRMVVPIKYTYLSFTEDKDLLKANENDHYGLITTMDKVALPISYFEIRALDKGFYLLTTQDSSYYNSFSFYDSKQKSLSKAPDSTIAIYNKDLAIIHKGGTAMLWDPAKNKIITGEYSNGGFPDQINYFINGLSIAYKHGKAGVIDTTGKIVIAFKYEGLSNFENGYALILSGKLDETTPQPWPYQNTRRFLSGYKHYGFIDSSGTVAIPPNYDLQWNSSQDQYFNGNYLVLYKNDQWGENPETGLADQKGNTIIPAQFDEITPLEDSTGFLVKRKKKFGILNQQGHLILPVEFDNIALQERPVFQSTFKLSFPVLAKKDGVWQYYKSSGKPLANIITKEMISFDEGLY